MASPDCALDVGGLTLHWLGNVPAAASLDLLATFTKGDTPQKVASGAALATAPRLIDLAKSNRNPEVRKQAMWLGQSQDPRALALFEDVLRAK